MFYGTTQRVRGYLMWVRMAESSITCLSIYAELYIFHAAQKYLWSSSCVVKVQVSSCFCKTSLLDPDFKPNLNQRRILVLFCQLCLWQKEPVCLRSVYVSLTTSRICHTWGIPSCILPPYISPSIRAKVTSHNCYEILLFFSSLPSFSALRGPKDALWLMLGH